MLIYLILNEIISSTIVYDQEANCSRGVILVVLGAPLNFIAMLYSVFPICGNIDLYLDPFQELLKEEVKQQNCAAPMFPFINMGSMSIDSRDHPNFLEAQ